MRQLFVLTAALAILPIPLSAQSSAPFNTPACESWADSVINGMSLERQIAQLLMPPVYAHADRVNWEEVEQWVQTHQIGGVIAMQGATAPYAERLNRLQSRADVPLLVSTDAEWGLGMRIDSTRSWPRSLTFGATADPELTQAMGREVGHSLRGMGFHVNFAPVVDVNSNPANPVIGSRSFGSSTELVSQLGTAYALGMQEVGVLATAKHFPGHGDTDADSHHALPIILHDRKRLDSIELAPFAHLIDAGVGAVMAAHLFIPALDDTPNLPSTLSPYIVDTLLRQNLGFDGLIFTDAMTMKGFTSFSKTQSPHADALIAGNDVLLFPGEPATVIREVMTAIEAGRLDSLQIAEKCHRVLRAKAWCRVWESPAPKSSDDAAESLHQAVIGQALTVIKNDNSALPVLPHVHHMSQMFVGFGGAPDAVSERVIKRIMPTSFDVQGRALTSAEFTSSGYARFLAQLETEPDWSFLHLGGTSHSASKLHGITDEEIAVALKCAAAAYDSNVPFGLVVYGSPYLLDRLGALIALSDAVLVAYQDDDRTVNGVAQALVGAGPAGGKLPIETQAYGQGFGMPWMGRTRLGFSAAPLSTKTAIDSIVEDAIARGAMPGCRVLAAHRGAIVHDGVYGTLDGKAPVKASSVYDLASITKIAATTLACMHLEEAGKLDAEQPLSAYLPELTDSDFGNRIIRDILAHRAGLKSWIPFYLEALEDSTAFNLTPSEVHSQRISDNLYMRPAWQDSIWAKICASEVDPVGTHRYSDLGFYALQRVIESLTLEPLNEFVERTFYHPVEWNSLGYRPLDRMKVELIAPTEHDTVFRKGEVRGDVHDPGAAMMEGVAGHAGLFGNAYDLARLMYMLRLGGFYGGNAFFEPQTVQRWVERVDPDAEHRKACGFDRPANDADAGPTCNEASPASFGHSGFTGTLAWADPDHDLIFVFLSNRTYPDAENRKLIDWDVRTKIQHQVYKAYGIPSRFTED